MFGGVVSGKTTTLACYHCGCQATEWLANDDPWNRHAELQPNCPVVKRAVVIWPEREVGYRVIDRYIKDILLTVLDVRPN